MMLVVSTHFVMIQYHFNLFLLILFHLQRCDFAASSKAWSDEFPHCMIHWLSIGTKGGMHATKSYQKQDAQDSPGDPRKKGFTRLNKLLTLHEVWLQ